MGSCSIGRLQNKNSYMIFRVIRAQKFSEQYSARLIKQVFSVLAYCHSNDIIHRDLKPENLLYIDSSPNSKIKVYGFCMFRDLEIR